MRKIDADYFIEFLKGMYKLAGWNDRDVHMSLRDVICNLDNVPTVVDSCQWTPVTEKLPDKKGEYLVTVEHRFSSSNKDVVSHSVIPAQFGQSAWCIHNSYDDDDDYDEYSNLEWYTTSILGIDISQKVIAWMPMPEPYKKGD